jgi:flagellar motor switch protein FliN
MTDGNLLTQEEIDALLGGNVKPVVSEKAEGPKAFLQEESEALSNFHDSVFSKGSEIFSEILNMTLEITLPEVKEMTLEEFVEEKKGRQVAIFPVEFEKVSRGAVALIFTKEDAAALANILMGGEEDEAPPELDAVCVSAIEEVFNKFLTRHGNAAATAYFSQPFTMRSARGEVREVRTGFDLGLGKELVVVEHRIRGGELFHIVFNVFYALGHAKELIEAYMKGDSAMPVVEAPVGGGRGVGATFASGGPVSSGREIPLEEQSVFMDVSSGGNGSFRAEEVLPPRKHDFAQVLDDGRVREPGRPESAQGFALPPTGFIEPPIGGQAPQAMQQMPPFDRGSFGQMPREQQPRNVAAPPNFFGEVGNSPHNVQPASFAPTMAPPGACAGMQNIDLLLDVSLQVTVELGRTRMLIKDILELGSGSIVELDKIAGESIDLLVNNKLIAKGEVVVIDENFGIRITSIVSPKDRLASLK